MAKDAPREPRLEDLTDDEIERIEADAFCCGGPPRALNWRMWAKADKACPIPETPPKS